MPYYRALGPLMPLNQSRLTSLRDYCFAYSTNKVDGNIPSWEELKKMLIEFMAEIEDTTEAEKSYVTQILFHTVPDMEYEAAVEYLKRTVTPTSLRELDKMLKQNAKDATATDISYPAKLQARNLLRKGGFTWNDIYLDDLAQELLVEAAKRFAEESERT